MTEIDQIDEQVVRLLNKRVRAAAEIGKIKHEMGLIPMIHPVRNRYLKKIEGLNEGSVPNDSLRAIYREVISSSIALEKDLTIGYLGPEATFTHQAAMLNFGSALSYRSLPDIPDVFQAVEKGSATMGSYPLKIRKGAVNRSLDLLVDTELTIIAQVYLKIEHCLFSPSSLDKIVEVRSKDQALAQCGEWLRA